MYNNSKNCRSELDGLTEPTPLRGDHLDRVTVVIT